MNCNFPFIFAAKYIDPTYIGEFEHGKGMKLVGNIPANSLPRCFYDHGFLGHIANSVHPFHKFPTQNARLDTKLKFSTHGDSLTVDSKLFSPGDLGYIPLVACKDIEAGEEIIINYGRSYWSKLDAWIKAPPEKSSSIIDRDTRKRRRELIVMFNDF